MRSLLKNQGLHPEMVTTDGLASYGAALRQLGLARRHRVGGLRENNRAENSHLVIRRCERKQQVLQRQRLCPALPVQPRRHLFHALAENCYLVLPCDAFSPFSCCWCPPPVALGPPA
jgi:transposase-like protein